MGMAAKNNVTTYSATSKLYIVNKDSFGIKMADLQLGTALTADYQEVFKTWEVHEMVIEELGLPYSYQEMQSMLTVSNPEDTRVLYITVTYPDAKMAAEIANSYAEAAKTFIIKNIIFHGGGRIGFVHIGFVHQGLNIAKQKRRCVFAGSAVG